MKEPKYYTPAIEEFHIGFEFEFETGINGWKKFILQNDRVDSTFKNVRDFSSQFRVKVLDEEDIESLEFKKRLNNQWIGWNDYILETISGEYGYFLTCTLHVPRMDGLYKIYVHRHLNNEKNDIETQLKNGESELVFKGKITNKSELKKTLKQLNII